MQRENVKVTACTTVGVTHHTSSPLLHRELTWGGSKFGRHQLPTVWLSSMSQSMGAPSCLPRVCRNKSVKNFLISQSTVICTRWRYILNLETYVMAVSNMGWQNQPLLRYHPTTIHRALPCLHTEEASISSMHRDCTGERVLHCIMMPCCTAFGNHLYKSKTGIAFISLQCYQSFIFYNKPSNTTFTYLFISLVLQS